MDPKFCYHGIYRLELKDINEYDFILKVQSLDKNYIIHFNQNIRNMNDLTRKNDKILKDILYDLIQNKKIKTEGKDLLIINEENDTINIKIKIPIFNIFEEINICGVKCSTVKSDVCETYQLQIHECLDNMTYQDLILEVSNNKCHLFGFIDMFSPSFDDIILPFYSNKIINDYLLIDNNKLSFYETFKGEVTKISPFDYLYNNDYIPIIKSVTCKNNQGGHTEHNFYDGSGTPTRPDDIYLDFYKSIIKNNRLEIRYNDGLFLPVANYRESEEFNNLVDNLSKKSRIKLVRVNFDLLPMIQNRYNLNSQSKSFTNVSIKRFEYVDITFYL